MRIAAGQILEEDAAPLRGCLITNGEYTGLTKWFRDVVMRIAGVANFPEIGGILAPSLWPPRGPARRLVSHGF